MEVLLLLQDSQHFQPCAFLFITLLPQGLMGVTTLGGLWVTTLTLFSPQENVLRDISKLNCLQYLRVLQIVHVILLVDINQLHICGLRRSTECTINS